MARNPSQADHRRYQKWLDQHDREWGGNIELKTGDPTGLIEPLFSAPWLPPQKYMRIVPGRPYDILIDYERMESDYRAQNAQYRKEALEEGMRQQGERYDPEAPVSRGVRGVIGLPPTPVEVVVAARQGNPWIIGRDPRPDVRLARYFIVEAAPDEEDYSTLQLGELHTEEGDALPPASEVPEGCQVVHRGGGRWVAMRDESPIKDESGERAATFESKEAAIAALRRTAPLAGANR